MILPGVNEVILAHMKLDPGIHGAPLEHKISEIKGYALIQTN